MRILQCFFIISLLGGCVTTPPKSTDNICKVFEQKRGWYKDAAKAANKWNTNIALLMAFIHRESDFVSNAKPPRRKLLWVIPWTRLSDAYGYAQARDATWDMYERAEGGIFASRNDFGDAVDFVGWYNNLSAKKCRISRTNPYKLYLAYHEGQGGYNRGTYRNKKAVKQYATKVKNRAASYAVQLKQCEAELKKRRWLFF